MAHSPAASPVPAAVDAAHGSSTIKVAATTSLRRLGTAVENFAAQLQCVICLCAYTNPSSLPCNHCFCEECIHRALELKPMCPICKAPANKRKLRFDSMLSKLLRATEALSAPVAAPSSTRTSSDNTTATGDADDAMLLEDKPPVPVEHQRTANRVVPATRAPRKPKTERRPRTKRVAPTTSNGNVAALTAAPSATATAAAHTNDHTAAPTITTAPTATAAPLDTSLRRQNGPFTLGQFVDVASRTWIGVNKPGGAALVTYVHDDDTYDVKYVLDSRRELRVMDAFITASSGYLTADGTPSRAVKARLRRPVQYSNDLDAGSVATLSPKAAEAAAATKRKRSDLVLLCSGYDDKGTNELNKWATVVDAEIVPTWTHRVTHLVVKCVSGSDKATLAATTAAIGSKRQLFSDTVVAGGETGTTPTAPTTAAATRWVKIRSMKYLKALVGGRWIVSEDWLQACATRHTHVSETLFEADGHLKGQDIDDAVRRSRKRRQANLAAAAPDVDPTTIGTDLFGAYCFHLAGDFLPPMPPQSELDTLLRIGGAQRLPSLEDVAATLALPSNTNRRLVIVSDRINPVALRDLARHLRASPALVHVPNVAIVNYQWVLNSISEAKLRPLK